MTNKLLIESRLKFSLSVYFYVTVKLQTKSGTVSGRLSISRI